MLWGTVIAIPIIYTIARLTSLLRNRSLARRTKLPYILFPFFEANLFYITLFETRWFPYVVNRVLPQNLADHIHDSIFRDRWAAKDRMAKKYGGVYLYVTPGGISCNIGDADVVEQVCKSSHSFVKPVKHLAAFQMYGRSVFTSEGREWSYHHRYTAPAFNDKNNALYTLPAGSGSRFLLPDAREDILNLSLNIICGAGFGVKLPFKPSPKATADDEADLFRDAPIPPPGYQFTFRSVMEYMNRSMISVFVANSVLPTWIPPHEDLEKFLHALVNIAEKSKEETHNLLESLVRSRREECDSTSNRAHGFSDADILGNVYIFSIAGHETTATTLRFALVLLALHEDIQEELHTEIVQVLGDKSNDPARWDYAAVFPRLTRPLCIMLETLRLYTPVVSIPKLTTTPGADLTYRGQTHHLPPNVRVNLNANAVHYSEEYWGADAATFNPARWDKRNADSFLAKNDGIKGLAGPGLESDSIHRPVRGAFVSFSDGVRSCIGRRFAQVEFVAVLVVLFHEYRVRPARFGQESDKDARGRAEKALPESSTALTLAITDKVPLEFERRSYV
ncbi:cytochrome P450 [Aspergillus lucknowensis]|uniref:Cytochrome P450 n=1 Tax=Aspergillus lucknowensis TaxID=176173 RepID=A0ABR4L5P0_9EURO